MTTTYNHHIFFCTDADCSNIVDSMDTVCYDCDESPIETDEYFTCECDGSGRLCRVCASEYAEPCRGCGLTTLLWTDNTYCRWCYVERYGDEFPIVVTIAPPPPKTPDQLRIIIQEIEDRLRTNMTKEQADDWRWLLMNRRAELAEALRY